MKKKRKIIRWGFRFDGRWSPLMHHDDLLFLTIREAKAALLGYAGGIKCGYIVKITYEEV